MSKYEILAYRGYGSATKARFYGRVVEKLGVSVSTDRDSLFRNLLNTWRRADSDPVGFAEVTVEYGGTKIDCKADDEGFLSGWIDALDPKRADWVQYQIEMGGVAKGTGEILVPPESSRFCVVSDIDDTVIQSR